MQFTDLEQLKVYLQQDAQVPDRFPVRYINVDSMEMWVKVKAHLSTIAHNSLRLSDFCENEDTAPNLTRLKSSIRTAKSSTLVVPLSEYLRINNSIAKKILNDILKANFENSHLGKLRIYIPLYRMKDILKSTDLDPREKKCIAYLDMNYDSDYSLTIVQDDLNVHLQGNQTRGYREYLRYWEQNPDKPVIFHTKNAFQYQDIVFADEVTVITNAYDLLRHHLHLPADVVQQFGTEAQWKELAQSYCETRNLEGAIGVLLPANQYSESLFQDWFKYSSFKQWLLWLWTKQKHLGGYLGHIADKSESVDEFTYLVHGGVLDLLASKNFEHLASQRRKLIADMKLQPPKAFLEAVADLEPVSQIMCLTDLSQKEKRMILQAFSKCRSSNSARNALKFTFPEAFYYLAGSNLQNKKIESYFSIYREQKISNEISDIFLQEVNDLAKENGSLLWELDARNAIVDNLYHNNEVILFVDALGIEYLSLLQYMFITNAYDVESRIGRCNLPSTTEFNTDFLSNRKHEKYYKLDEQKHSSTNYPDNVIAEFELLKEIKAKVDELLQTASAVILTADHGTSRMAVLYRSQSSVHPCKESAQLEKYGRYCIDTSNDYSEIEGCFHYNNYWIFGNYSRFAEKGAPRCETHGGASLEEAIVPILRISKKEFVSIKRTAEKITVLTPDINAGMTNTVTVAFKLSGNYSTVTAIIADQTRPCEVSNGEYRFTVAVKSSGQLLVKLRSNGIIIGEFSIKVIKGISSKSDFDI
ncbi:BREX-4 system phosphatase PglZ [Flexilinea flocculi]|uniref:DUF7863 domain-containing protein n=1 Tax=Flexilinea flocculi TaxID=1678840 RepID=A0A0S7BRH2_9CHLR|nr:BREX-4 system phosphatase PglZ [Flexilinea flocculi]GAP40935.1 hypothetical protein ATC1_13917 [Flexilinea flocculi]